MVKPKSNLISYSLLRNVRDWEAIVDAGAKCAGVFADAPCRVQIPARIVKTISNQADRGCNGGPTGVAVIIRQQGLALYLKQRD